MGNFNLNTVYIFIFYSLMETFAIVLMKVVIKIGVIQMIVAANLPIKTNVETLPMLFRQ